MSSSFDTNSQVLKKDKQKKQKEKKTKGKKVGEHEGGTWREQCMLFTRTSVCRLLWRRSKGQEAHFATLRLDPRWGLYWGGSWVRRDSP